MQDKYITVSQLTHYIKFLIDNDAHLNNVFLKGEISNFKAHTRGHYYFTLKDENARINAVMFQAQASKLKFLPNDGMKVMVCGRISVYEANGGYQIYVNEMIEDGVGNLYVAYEQLKKKLELEGLFDSAHKRPIPRFPKTIGIITAPTGAAIRDMLSTIKRRWPLTHTILFPSLVQGASAAPEIVKQIDKAQNYELDLLIVGRGGGSIEDMWCFNDEEVARAIYRSNIPVISAVGHEIDFTIADFVADLRAPTPTGAAEMAVPNQTDFYRFLDQLYLRLEKAMQVKLKKEKEYLRTIQESYILKNPLSLYQMKEQKFDAVYERLAYVMTKLLTKQHQTIETLKIKLENEMNYTVQKTKNNYVHLLTKLETLNPLLTIQRGYAIPKKEGKVVTKIEQVQKEDILDIQVMDGTICTKVVRTKK